MKKGLKVLSIAALTLLLGSCTNAVVENQIQTQIKREEIKVNEENKKMCEDALTYIDLNVDKNRIVTDLKLQSSGMYKTFLQWESSNPEVIKIVANVNDNGRTTSYDGKVNRQLTDVKVTLKCIATVDDDNASSAFKEIEVTVLKAPENQQSSLSLAFEEDFSSYKTGLDLSEYYSWSMNKSEGGKAKIVEELEGNFNDMPSDKVLKITSDKLASELTYSKKINADEKCVLEGSFLVYGETNGVSFETYVGTSLASRFRVSSSGYSYSNGSETKTSDIKVKEGVWTRFRITYSTVNGYYAVQLYSRDGDSTLINLSEPYGTKAPKGKKGAMTSFVIRVHSGSKFGTTYVANLKFAANSSANPDFPESAPQRVNRSEGLGEISNYEKNILLLEGQEAAIPEFVVKNRFNDEEIYVKDVDYTLTKESKRVGNILTNTYKFKLLATNETKEVIQTIYFDAVENVADISDFKVSYVKALKTESGTSTSLGKITISGKVIRKDATIHYLVLTKGSVAPSIDDVINPSSSLSGYVVSGSVVQTTSEVNFDTAEVNLNGAYDVYVVSSNLYGKKMYEAKEVSTLVNISSCEDFYDMTNNIDTKGSKFRLINDLDFSNYEWKHDVNNTLKFVGELDGQGFTIRNLLISTTAPKVGIFYQLGGVVKNLNFVDCKVLGASDAGIVASNMYGGSIENVNFTNCEVSQEESIGGGGDGYFGIAVGRNRSEGTTHAFANINIINGKINAPKYIGLLTAGIEKGVTCSIDNITADGRVNTEGAAIGLIGRNRGTTTLKNGIVFLNISYAKKEVGIVAGHNKEGGKLIVDNFLGDLTIDGITQVNYFNDFIGSHDASTSSYNATRVYFMNEDYSHLSESISPDVKAISLGTKVDKPLDGFNKRWFEENCELGDLDVSTIFVYDESISRPVVMLRDSSTFEFSASYINSFIDEIKDHFTVKNHYYILKALYLLDYVKESERSEVKEEKLMKAKELYESVMGDIKDASSSLGEAFN